MYVLIYKIIGWFHAFQGNVEENTSDAKKRQQREYMRQYRAKNNQKENVAIEPILPDTVGYNHGNQRMVI